MMPTTSCYVLLILCVYLLGCFHIISLFFTLLLLCLLASCLCNRIPKNYRQQSVWHSKCGRTKKFLIRFDDLNQIEREIEREKMRKKNDTLTAMTCNFDYVDRTVSMPITYSMWLLYANNAPQNKLISTERKLAK